MNKDLPKKLEDSDSRLLCASLDKIRNERTPYYIHFNAAPELLAEEIRKELTRRYNMIEDLIEFSELLRKHGAIEVSDVLNAMISGSDWREFWWYDE